MEVSKAEEKLVVLKRRALAGTRSVVSRVTRRQT
jgi:hypothetical protein